MDCLKCSNRGFSFLQFSEKYDSHYCGICGDWLEEACDDPECCHCSNRPALAINNEDDLDWDKIISLVNDPNFE